MILFYTSLMIVFLVAFHQKDNLVDGFAFQSFVFFGERESGNKNRRALYRKTIDRMTVTT